MEKQISKDVTGHVAEDGKTVLKPLEGKTAKEIFEAHHSSGFDPKKDKGCECAHCIEHLATVA